MGQRQSNVVYNPEVEVVVLGAGYAGCAVAKALDPHFHVTLVDRKERMHHTVGSARATTTPGFQFRSQVPYTHLLSNGKVLRAQVVSVTPRKVEVRVPTEVQERKGRPDRRQRSSNATEAADAVDGTDAEGDKASESGEAAGDGSIASDASGGESGEGGVEDDGGVDEKKREPGEAQGNRSSDARAEVKEPPALFKTLTLFFDYLVIATGTGYNFPMRSVSSRFDDVARMFDAVQKYVAESIDVLVVGGGPTGCTFAGEIKARYPATNVTLVHAGQQLMSRRAAALKPEFVQRVRERLEGLGVNIMLKERVVQRVRQLPNGKISLVAGADTVTDRRALSTLTTVPPTIQLPPEYRSPTERLYKFPKDEPLGFECGHQMLRTESGKHLDTDLVFFCTGERFDDSLFNVGDAAGPWAGVVSDRGVIVNDQLQAGPYEHVFAAGDCIDGGYLHTVENAQRQAKCVAENILARERALPPVRLVTAGETMTMALGRDTGVAQMPHGTLMGDRFVALYQGRDMLCAQAWAAMNMRHFMP